jgi:hypothetical protein
VFAKRWLGTSHGRLADGRLHQVEPLGVAIEAPASATATKARDNPKSSKQLILFFDQSYYKTSFL